ncbi:MAG: hypothetical protein HRT45_02115 [Bdellovibrionales bacterium]|nr:hypothetical protein [Bdellovibrionales bacterium]
MGVTAAQLVLVDPYAEVSVDDLVKFPQINVQNHKFAEAMNPSILDAKRTLVATWSENQEVMPMFREFRRLSSAQSLAEQASSKTLIYFGFHYGRCMLNMPAGVLAMRRLGFDCYVLRSQSMLYPADTWRGRDHHTLAAGAWII